MHRFCTLFDSNYLSRGLAMYRSLCDTGEDFTLYILCFDDRVMTVLKRMDLPFLVLISLQDFETDALRQVKQDRNRAEYCWTCTPHVIMYVLETFSLPAVTYLDADLFFYQKPSLLLEEFEPAGASVLITEHRYSARYRHLLKAGIYCVQFMTFKADEHGLEVLAWWQERCLEWCYDRLEGDRFGDQKYLDEWPQRYSCVHVLRHQGGGIAPWNVQRYGIATHAGELWVEDKESKEQARLVFYHFHHVRFYDNGYLELGHYDLGRDVKRLLYKPYIARLNACAEEVAAYDATFDANGPVKPAKGVIKALGRLQRRLKGNYISLEKFRKI